MENGFRKNLKGEEILILCQVHNAIKGAKSLTTYMVYLPNAGHYAIYTLGNGKDR